MPGVRYALLSGAPRAPCFCLSRGGRNVSDIHLNDEDVAYLLTLLRSASQPLTTQQLIDALRHQSEPSNE